MSRYLITLDAPDQDAAALEDATAYGDDRVAGIVTGDIDGVPVAAKVQIEVEAPTVTSAGQEAQQIYADLRAHAGLSEIGEQPTAIMPLNPNPPESVRTVRPDWLAFGESSASTGETSKHRNVGDRRESFRLC